MVRHEEEWRGSGGRSWSWSWRITEEGGDEGECWIYCVFHWAVFMVHDKSGQEGGKEEERRRIGRQGECEVVWSRMRIDRKLMR